MKHHETRTVAVQDIARVTCDICKRDFTRRDCPSSHTADVTLECRLVWDRSPKEDLSEIDEIDCCFECFEHKVKSAIEALGCKFRKVEL